jgi:hypothetical protein
VAFAAAFAVHMAAKLPYRRRKLRRMEAEAEKLGKTIGFAAATGGDEHYIRTLRADVAALAQRTGVVVGAFVTRSLREDDPIVRRLWSQQAVSLQAIDRRFLSLTEDMQQLVQSEDELVLLLHARHSDGDLGHVDTDGAAREGNAGLVATSVHST